MSTGHTATDSAGQSQPSANTGLFPRLGSALALAPLGVWTVFHLWDNLYAYGGAQAWERRVTVERHPVFEILTSVVILLPLVLHTIWGIRRIRMMRVNVGQYRTLDNVKYILQRLSAIGLVLFLIAHIFKARLEPLIESGSHERFQHIACFMRNHPPTLIVYILGVLAIAYHLANGISTAGLTWGYAASESARKKLQIASTLFFVVLLVMGWSVLFIMYDKAAVFACKVD